MHKSSQPMVRVGDRPIPRHQFELKSFRALGVAFFGAMAPSPLNLHKNAAANMLR